MKRSILLVVIAAGLLAFTPGVLHASASPAPLSPDLHEISTWGEHAKTAQLMLIVFQLAAMLAAAKLAGWAIEKIGVPGVVGELLAGVIIGPYLLGNLIHLPLGSAHWVPLFPAPSVGQWPVNDVIWAIAQIASIVLLFVTGLQTDLQQFLKYVGPASLIALVGFLIPMLLGTGVVYIPQFAAVARASADQSLLVPALFVGAILAATSIGITARVLGDLRKLDTPEGVTILGLAPLLWTTAVGAEVLRPMVIPVLGGLLIADEVIDLFLPVLFYHVRLRRWRRLHGGQSSSARGWRIDEKGGERQTLALSQNSG